MGPGTSRGTIAALQVGNVRTGSRQGCDSKVQVRKSLACSGKWRGSRSGDCACQSSMRPRQLANELGIDAKSLRSWLRHEHPRSPSEKGRPWDLSPKVVASARRHFSSRHPQTPELDEGMGHTLPPLLRDGLRVVFVGVSPLPHGESIRTGNYYADSGNCFYDHLLASGFVRRPIDPSEHKELLGYGIGLDDVYSDPGGLRARLEQVRPRAVCFNSKQALERFAGYEISSDGWRGDKAGRHACFSGVAIVWGVPDSSHRARGHRVDRKHLLKELRKLLDSQQVSETGRVRRGVDDTEGREADAAAP